MGQNGYRMWCIFFSWIVVFQASYYQVVRKLFEYFKGRLRNNYVDNQMTLVNRSLVCWKLLNSLEYCKNNHITLLFFAVLHPLCVTQVLLSTMGPQNVVWLCLGVGLGNVLSWWDNMTCVWGFLWTLFEMLNLISWF